MADQYGDIYDVIRLPHGGQLVTRFDTVEASDTIKLSYKYTTRIASNLTAYLQTLNNRQTTQLRAYLVEAAEPRVCVTASPREGVEASSRGKFKASPRHKFKSVGNPCSTEGD
jgi:hypothetical protein